MLGIKAGTRKWAGLLVVVAGVLLAPAHHSRVVAAVGVAGHADEGSGEEIGGESGEKVALHVGNEAQIGRLGVSWLEVLRQGLGLQGLRFFVDVEGVIGGGIGSGEAVGGEERRDDGQPYFDAFVNGLALHLFEARPLLLAPLQATVHLLLYLILDLYLNFYNRNAFL